MEHNVRYNIDDLNYQNLIIPKLVLKPGYRSLFEHHDILMQGLHRMYHLVILEFPESELLLDPPALPDCDNWATYKLNNFLVNNTY